MSSDPTNTEEISLDTPVWGIKGIAKVINRNPRQTHYLLASGDLDATKVRELWVSTPRRLLKRIIGE